MSRLLICLVALTLLACAAPAAAQTRAEKQEAKQHFENGSKLYADGRWEKALVEFRKGDALFPNPLFRYNMALCLWRLDHLDEAIEQARLARDELSGGDDAKAAALNAARLAAFERIASARQHAIPEVPIVAETTPIPKPEKHSSPLTWIGGGLAVVGVGVLGGWGYLEVSLGDTIDRYETAAANGDSATYTTLRGQIADRQQIAKVLLFSGAGAAALGGALLLVGLTSSDHEVSLYATPSGVTAAVRF